MFAWLSGKRRAFLEPEDEAWVLETCAWLLRHFGGLAELRRMALVQATPAFFPATDQQGHARAEHIFAQVKLHAGMRDWPCRLVAQSARPELRVGEVLALKPVGRQAPAGTFSLDGNAVVITYDPAALAAPQNLIATLAHELAHYRLRSLPERPPGGDEMEEFSTDIATVFLGFGLFGANAAFNFQQYQSSQSQGWSWSRHGYLGEREWCFVLAIFALLRNDPAGAFQSGLKPHVFTQWQKAKRYLERDGALLARLQVSEA